MASTGLPALDNTLGCLLLSAIFTMGLWGAGSLQTYNYFNRYSNDATWLKTHVAVVWILDTAHEALIIASTYQYLISNYGVVTSLGLLFPALKHTIILTALICCFVQTLFIIRIYHVSRKSKLIAGAAAVLVLAQFAVTVAYYGRVFHFTTFAELQTVFPHTRAINIVTAITDTFIASLLVYFLHTSRTGIKQTDSVLNRLIMFSVNTGLLTSICAIISLITGLALPQTLVYILFYQCISRLYMNSMLASLNSRQSLSGALNSTQASSFTLSNIAHQEQNRLAAASTKATLSGKVSHGTNAVQERGINLENVSSHRTEESFKRSLSDLEADRGF